MGRAAGSGASWSPFDSLAGSYDRWYETPLGSFVDRAERQAVFGLLGARPRELILDVGSGTGRYASELARRGVRCIGLEPAQAMLAVAQRGAAPNGPTYVRGIAERLPLASLVFDAVICVATLEFVADVDAVWKAARFSTRAEMEQRLQAFGDVRSRLCVYVPPQLGHAPWPLLSLVEWMGARVAPSLGAFMAFRVDLRR